MATIQKRKRDGSTVYRAMVRIKGFPPQQKTFKRLTDARLWAQQTEAAIRKGEFKNVVSTANSRTVADLIARYRKEVLPHKAPSTQRAEQTYLAFWERTLGAYALSYIDPDRINAALADLSEAGDSRRQRGDGERPNRPKQRKTLKHYRDTLALLFRHAETWGWTGSNPVDGVTPITKLRNERVRYLDQDERRRLLDACRQSTNPQLYTIVVFALSTGARKGEILNLTLDDVDLSRDRAVLRDTKNGETRGVPIVGHIHELLSEHVPTVRAQYDAMSPAPKTRWLFPGRDGRTPIDIRTAWENARDKAAVTDFRFHDLRHSTASYLAMQGANPMEIAEVLGHRTLQMVKRYSHLSEGHVRGLVAGLDEEMFSGGNGAENARARDDA